MRFYRATSHDDADFEKAFFLEGAEFLGVGELPRDKICWNRRIFASAEFEHGMFVRTVVQHGVTLAFSYVGEGGVQLVEVGSEKSAQLEDPPSGPALIRMGAMSAERVTFRRSCV